MKRKLEELLNNEPFQPFIMVLTSGDRFTIENPGLVDVAEDFLTYYVPRSDAQAFVRLSQLVFLQAEPVNER